MSTNNNNTKYTFRTSEEFQMWTACLDKDLRIHALKKFFVLSAKMGDCKAAQMIYDAIMSNRQAV